MSKCRHILWVKSSKLIIFYYKLEILDLKRSFFNRKKMVQDYLKEHDHFGIDFCHLAFCNYCSCYFVGDDYSISHINLSQA